MIALGFTIYVLTIIPAIIAGMIVFMGIKLDSKLISSKVIVSIWLALGLAGFIVLLYGLFNSPIGLRYIPNFEKALCGFIVLQGALTKIPRKSPPLRWLGYKRLERKINGDKNEKTEGL